MLANGKPVRDRQTWIKQRRPEILRMYETEIYGRMPAKTPAVTWQVTETDDARARRHGGDEEDRGHDRVSGPSAGDQLDALHAGRRKEAGAGDPARQLRRRSAAAAAQGRGGAGFPSDPPVAAEIIAAAGDTRPSGIRTSSLTGLNTFTQGVIGAQRWRPGQEQPAPDEWGTISAWSWGVSRIIDYLETDKAVNAKQIALFGHSRLGKTALWATAKDERIAAAFSSCSGEMGAALARRDWGETVDDMAQNFPWQFAGNFQKWAGRWNEMPVDAHMLIALSAPRPVFISGGTTDQWADPVGMFMAAVAAGPVYRLLGKKDLGVTELPPLDTPVITGDLGWHYHTGGHTATPADWKAFLDFLGKYF